MCLICSLNGVLQAAYWPGFYETESSLTGSDTQDMDCTLYTLDLGAHVVALGEWWMWEWGTLRVPCTTMKNMNMMKR